MDRMELEIGGKDKELASGELVFPSSQLKEVGESLRDLIPSERITLRPISSQVYGKDLRAD